jgi:protocatechuate 3,4-dioxygenase beta subunit
MRKNKIFCLLSLMAGFITALLISGCGGGGGGGNTLTLGGEVYDDILDGANVSFYLTDPNNPIAQTITHADGTYQTRIKVSGGTKIVYTRATGGRFVSSGEEFAGALYGVAPLQCAADKSLKVHLNPVTSLLYLYMTQTPGITSGSGSESGLADALAHLAARLKQIDANTPDVITSSDLSGFNRQAAFVQRISNLIGYQVDQEDPNVSSIDKVIGRMAADWLPDVGLSQAFKSGPGLRQSLELAEAAMEHGKGELTGRVIDLNDPNNPIDGAIISVRGTAFHRQTDKNGNFFFSRLPAGIDLMVDVKASGYAGTQAVIRISPVERSQGIVIKVKAVDSRVALDMNGGIVARCLAVARYQALTKQRPPTLAVNAAGGGLQVSTLDNAITLTFPPEALGAIRRHLFRRKSLRQAKLSGDGEENAPHPSLSPVERGEVVSGDESKRYSDAEQNIIYVNITSIDPTREIDAFPGDFTTSDPNAAGEEGEKRGKKLESVVMGEFSLEYEDGKPVTDLDLGAGVEIRFRLPDALQEMYRQKYEQGERLIPWYGYDPNTGVWERSDEPAELIMINEAQGDASYSGDTRVNSRGKPGADEAAPSKSAPVMYAVARATHSGWWNVGWPVETHGCIEGHVYDDKNGLPMVGVQIQASGIDYQGQSYGMTDSGGYYSITVKKDAWSRITARRGAYEVVNPGPVYVDQQKSSGCEQANIPFHLVDICGRVVNSQMSDYPMSDYPYDSGIYGAYVYASTGVGKFTDLNGDFHLVSGPDTSLKLKVCYTSNRINYYVTRDITIGSNALCDASKVIIPLNLSPQYVRGTVTIIENGVPKHLKGKEVRICADNGFTTANDPNGNYEVVVERDTEQVNIYYRYYAQMSDYPNGTCLKQGRTIRWLNPTTLQPGVDPKVTFDVRPVWIYGTVTDSTSGNPVPNVRISTTLGTYTLSDPNTGEYRLEVPSDTTFELVARLLVPAAGLVEEQRQRISTDFADVGLSQSEKLVNFVLDSRVARIIGQVKEAVSGKVLPYVSIVSEYRERTLTDSNGFFTLIVPDRSLAEKVKVAFICGGYEPEFRDFDTPQNRGDTSIVTVELEKRNHRPVIQKVDVNPGFKVCLNDASTPVTLGITAVDVDADPLSYSVEMSEETAQGLIPIPGDPNRFTWDTPETAGLYTLTVRVSDVNPSGNLTTAIQLPIKVVNCSGLMSDYPNKNPVIIFITRDKTGVPNQTESFGVVAYDPDGDSANLAYQWHVFAPGSIPGPATDLISTWSHVGLSQDPDHQMSDYPMSDYPKVDLTIPANPFVGLDANQPAKFSVRVEVSDDKGGKVEKDTHLIILVNRPPVIKSLEAEPGQCILGDRVKLFGRAVDPDDRSKASPLTYTWSCLGETIGSDPNMTWTIPGDAKYVGDLAIGLTVRDHDDPDHPRSASQSLHLIVGANNAPVITSLSAARTRVLPNDEVNVQAAVTDPEGRMLSCAWSCTGGTILAGQGTYQITWKAPQSDDYTISLKVSDGLKEAVRQIGIRVTTLTVNAGENQALALADMTGPPISPVSLNARINSSPAGEPYTLTWQIDPASIPDGANPSLDHLDTPSTNFMTDKAGRYHFLLTVTMIANSEISEQDDVWVQVYEHEPPWISGYVKDDRDNPVSQAAVQMYDITDRQTWDRKTVTDDNGYYEFTGIPSGTYYVVIARNGYLQITKTVTIPAE